MSATLTPVGPSEACDFFAAADVARMRRWIDQLAALPATLANGCLELAAQRHREGMIGAEWQPLPEAGLDLQPVPTAPGDEVFFDSFVPHSWANASGQPRLPYLTYYLAADGDQRDRYHADTHAAFPRDIERDATKTHVFRV